MLPSNIEILLEFSSTLSLPILNLLRKKCPYSELFWSAFSRIRTEYDRHFVSIRIQWECGKIRNTITPNMRTFNVPKYSAQDCLENFILLFTLLKKTPISEKLPYYWSEKVISIE